MKDNKLPQPKLQEDFDVTRYLGDWYELYRSKSICFEKGADITARYGSDPNTLIAWLSPICRPSITVRSILSPGTQSGNRLKPRHLIWSYVSTGSSAGKYKVIQTDYETYSISSLFPQHPLFDSSRGNTAGCWRGNGKLSRMPSWWTASLKRSSRKLAWPRTNSLNPKWPIAK